MTHDLEGEIQIKSGNPGVRTHDVEVSWHAKNDKRRREFLDSFHWSFPMFNFILDDFFVVVFSYWDKVRSYLYGIL